MTLARTLPRRRYVHHSGGLAARAAPRLACRAVGAWDWPGLALRLKHSRRCSPRLPPQIRICPLQNGARRRPKPIDFDREWQQQVARRSASTQPGSATPRSGGDAAAPSGSGARSGADASRSGRSGSREVSNTQASWSRRCAVRKHDVKEIAREYRLYLQQPQQAAPAQASPEPPSPELPTPPEARPTSDPGATPGKRKRPRGGRKLKGKGTVQAAAVIVNERYRRPNSAGQPRPHSAGGAAVVVPERYRRPGSGSGAAAAGPEPDAGGYGGASGGRGAAMRSPSPLTDDEPPGPPALGERWQTSPGGDARAGASRRRRKKRAASASPAASPPPAPRRPKGRHDADTSQGWPDGRTLRGAREARVKAAIAGTSVTSPRDGDPASGGKRETASERARRVEAALGRNRSGSVPLPRCATAPRQPTEQAATWAAACAAAWPALVQHPHPIAVG